MTEKEIAVTNAVEFPLPVLTSLLSRNVISTAMVKLIHGSAPTEINDDVKSWLKDNNYVRKTAGGPPLTDIALKVTEAGEKPVAFSVFKIAGQSIDQTEGLVFSAENKTLVHFIFDLKGATPKLGKVYRARIEKSSDEEIFDFGDAFTLRSLRKIVSKLKEDNSNIGLAMMYSFEDKGNDSAEANYGGFEIRALDNIIYVEGENTGISLDKIKEATDLLGKYIEDKAETSFKSTEVQYNTIPLPEFEASERGSVRVNELTKEGEALKDQLLQAFLLIPSTPELDNARKARNAAFDAALKLPDFKPSQEAIAAHHADVESLKKAKSQDSSIAAHPASVGKSKAAHPAGKGIKTPAKPADAAPKAAPKAAATKAAPKAAAPKAAAPKAAAPKAAPAKKSLGLSLGDGTPVKAASAPKAAPKSTSKAAPASKETPAPKAKAQVDPSKATSLEDLFGSTGI